MTQLFVSAHALHYAIGLVSERSTEIQSSLQPSPSTSTHRLHLTATSLSTGKQQGVQGFELGMGNRMGGV